MTEKKQKKVRSKEEVYASKPESMQKLSKIQTALRCMDVRFATNSNIIGFLIDKVKDIYTTPEYTETNKDGVEYVVPAKVNYKAMLYHIQEYIELMKTEKTFSDKNIELDL